MRETQDCLRRHFTRSEGEVALLRRPVPALNLQSDSNAFSFAFTASLHKFTGSCGHRLSQAK